MSFYLPQHVNGRSSPKYFLMNYLPGGMACVPAVWALVSKFLGPSCLSKGAIKITLSMGKQERAAFLKQS